MKRSDVVERLRACANDPMWADHAEVNKATLRAAVALLSEAKAVPREPTQAMLDAVRNRPHPTRPDGWADRHAVMWRRMWDAAS